MSTLKTETLPVCDTIYNMRIEAGEIAKRLNELIDLEHFKDILTDGESTSIRQIAANCKQRAEFLNHISGRFGNHE